MKQLTNLNALCQERGIFLRGLAKRLKHAPENVPATYTSLRNWVAGSKMSEPEKTKAAIARILSSIPLISGEFKVVTPEDLK